MEEPTKIKLSIPLLLGSYRIGRQSLKVAQFILEELLQNNYIQTELIDLREYEELKMKRDEIYGNQPKNDAVIDFTPFLGTWINSNEKTAWIEKFTLTKRNHKIVIHAYSAQSPQDWGEAEVTTFIDNIGEKAFYSHYNLGSVESLLAANMNKGLWVIAAFHKFKDGEQPNFLCREFYYRAEDI